MDHDQRFKHLLREFFREFMELFFPAQAARLDFASVEWLDKELFTDPPQGEKKSSTWSPSCRPSRRVTRASRLF